MFSLEQFVFEKVAAIINEVINDGVKYAGLSFFEKLKIQKRVELATAEVIEPLVPFISREGISSDKQERLILTCVEELRPLTVNTSRLFQGSLDGQMIFDELYKNRPLPQVIVEDGLRDIYLLLFPRIATLLCKIPAAVKDWESEAWIENYRRFDELKEQLLNLFNKVDEIVVTPSKRADETLEIARKMLFQKIKIDLDLTGLGAGRPMSGKFSDFFVHPELKEVLDNKLIKEHGITTSEDSLKYFINSHRQSIIIGSPGAGKSTWVKWLQRELLSSSYGGLVFRVDLRGLSLELLPSLHQVVRESIGKHLEEDVTPEKINSWLKLQKLTFILDGFDEIGAQYRDSTLNWIREWVMVARGCYELWRSEKKRKMRGWNAKVTQVM